MMTDNFCAKCKYGNDIKPEGQSPPQGKVWCGQRGMQMGKNRRMPRHVPISGAKTRHFVSCKKAKMLKPLGRPLSLGMSGARRNMKRSTSGAILSVSSK